MPKAELRPIDGVAALRARPRRAVTLLELLIVFAIIGIMLSLLFPAIQAARQASLATACDNNVRQLALGVSQYLDINRGYFPSPPQPDMPGGWALNILPFIEEGQLADRFAYDRPIASPVNMAAAEHRPPLFVCPVTSDIPSTINSIGVTHYLLMVDMKGREWHSRNREWKVLDVPEGSRFPWVTSPERSLLDDYPTSHGTAFGL